MLLEHETDAYEQVHVPMEFSRDIGNVGSFQFRKVFELCRVIARTVRARFRGFDTLYYPPAGPNAIPIARDVVILLSTRWMFRATVFHFHAGGLAEYVANLRPLPRWFAERAYRRPDLAIRPSASAARDGRYFGAVRDVVVYYGVVPPSSGAARSCSPKRHISLVSVGALRESKGTDALLAATGRLRAEGHEVKLTLVGDFASDRDRDRILQLVRDTKLQNDVKFSGVLTGAAKSEAYAGSDIFCFPTFYESEAAPLVVLEAMSFGLPVVSTTWRGIPDLVDDSCAILVDPGSVDQLVVALRQLVTNPEAMATMGRSGRRRFLAGFTAEHYRVAMEQAFASLDVGDERANS